MLKNHINNNKKKLFISYFTSMTCANSTKHFGVQADKLRETISHPRRRKRLKGTEKMKCYENIEEQFQNGYIFV